MKKLYLLMLAFLIGWFTFKAKCTTDGYYVYSASDIELLIENQNEKVEYGLVSDDEL